MKCPFIYLLIYSFKSDMEFWLKRVNIEYSFTFHSSDTEMNLFLKYKPKAVKWTIGQGEGGKMERDKYISRKLQAVENMLVCWMVK